MLPDPGPGPITLGLAHADPLQGEVIMTDAMDLIEHTLQNSDRMSYAQSKSREVVDLTADFGPSNHPETLGFKVAGCAHGDRTLIPRPAAAAAGPPGPSTTPGPRAGPAESEPRSGSLLSHGHDHMAPGPGCQLDLQCQCVTGRPPARPVAGALAGGPDLGHAGRPPA